jgi:lipoprotein-releasing system permease protein
MSPLPFEFALALRYLRPKRTFFSIITLISILGVTLGVSVLMIVIAVMTGFDRQLRARLVGFQAHVQVLGVGEPITGWRQLVDEIGAMPEVSGVAPFINTQVLFETQPESGNPVPFGAMVRGIDPRLEAKVSDLTNTVTAGEFRLTPKSLLVGYELARDYNLRPGDRLAVYSLPALRKMHEAYKEKREEASLAADYLVRGVLDLGLNDLNTSLIVTSLSDAQQLGGQEDGIQGLKVMLHSPDEFTTESVQAALVKRYQDRYRVTTWLRDNSTMLNALQTERAMMFYILFFIVIVAAFGIMSALITFVVQKTREIGVLKAIGCPPASVAALFLGQSLVVGVLGVLSGLAFGTLALRYRNEFLHFMSEKVGFNLFPAEIYQFRELPAEIVTRDVVIICGGSLVVCILAGVLPAVRAALLQPVEALRNE